MVSMPMVPAPANIEGALYPLTYRRFSEAMRVSENFFDSPMSALWIMIRRRISAKVIRQIMMKMV